MAPLLLFQSTMVDPQKDSNLSGRTYYLASMGVVLVMLGLFCHFFLIVNFPENSHEVHYTPKNQALKDAQALDSAYMEHEFFNFEADEALKDPYDRISSEFKVTPLLYRRVKFWFDVYTKYDSNHHIIHHLRYPWVIYEVIDIQPFLEGKGPLWLRRQRALNYVSRRKSFYQQQLRKLSRLKNYRRLTEKQMELYQRIKRLPGGTKASLRLAAKSLRSQLGQKDFFTAGLENSTKYLSQFEQIFETAGLPTELTRLPFVESSFNEKAQSKVGASGVWQIMPSTGKKFSIVGRYIDERNSPVKAAWVAAKLLKQNYRILKSWPLAVTAYNNGTGNLRRAIRRARSRKLSKLIQRNYRGAFKFASSNFYTSFLAALYAEKYHREIFRDTTLVKHPQLSKVQIRLKRRYRPKTLARLSGLSLEKLIDYNLDIKKAAKKNRPLPSGFTLMLPPRNKEILQNTLKL